MRRQRGKTGEAVRDGKTVWWRESRERYIVHVHCDRCDWGHSQRLQERGNELSTKGKQERGRTLEKIPVKMAHSRHFPTHLLTRIGIKEEECY